MTYKQIDFLADLVNPVLAVALIVLIFALKTKDPWQFLLRAVAATVVSWLLSRVLGKLTNDIDVLGKDFPSTHYAVTLPLVTALFVLRRRFIWISIPIAIAYAWVMNYQEYHTYLEMAGALYAIPLTLAIFWPVLKRREPAAALDA